MIISRVNLRSRSLRFGVVEKKLYECLFIFSVSFSLSPNNTFLFLAVADVELLGIRQNRKVPISIAVLRPIVYFPFSFLRSWF